MGIFDELMGFPRLYAAVQNSIAGSMHQEKTSLSGELPDEDGIKILDLGCGVLDRGKFVRGFTAYEKLLRDHYTVHDISARRAGLLDYIFYRL